MLPTIYILNRADDLKGARAMLSGIRIVSICDDEALSKSRELVLKSAGHDVHSFFSWNAPDASLIQSCQIAIICRSVEEDRARSLNYLFRGLNGTLKILHLHALVDAGDEHRLGGSAFLNLVENACGVDAMN